MFNVKCKDCKAYYNGCDTEVYTMGYDVNDCEKCPLFKAIEKKKEFKVSIYPNEEENEGCETIIEKDGVEMKLTTEETRELYSSLSLAASFNFELPF